MSTFTPEQVAKHNSDNDCWIIVDGLVYDVTNFLSNHPGGKKILAREGGKDATKKFHMFHSADVMRKHGPKLLVGALPGHEGKLPTRSSGGSAQTLSSGKSQAFKKVGTQLEVINAKPYGEGVPFGDANWYQGLNTAYYNESHLAWRAHVREFVEREVIPDVHKWDEAYQVPKSMYTKMYAAGLLPAVVGQPWPSKYVDVPGPDNFDIFHQMILIEEFCRAGSGGLVWAVFGGLSIGLPPLLHFGSEELRARVAPACLRGEKFICLAISEPQAGSDVAGLTTTARREGDHYIVNGAKKWITNGVWCDYFTVAVRTGGPGQKGLSLLLIERDMPGVTTKHMKCMGVWASGTTYITFEDVKVPVSNLIGKENEGFKYVMYNFNPERWGTIVQSIRFARVCYEEAFKYAMKRKTFGKPLMEHQVIRGKLAEMARQIESAHAWLENITFQMNSMSHMEGNLKLGGIIALLKVHGSRVMEFCAREAAQIFGGASYVRGGVGEKIERIYREARAYAIPAGSEEILLDFAMRQAARDYARRSRL